MAITKEITLVETRMARTAIEHLNETKPRYLLEMYRESPRVLKKEIEDKVLRAFDLKARYLEEGLNETQAMELVNLFLADPEELPLEDQEELSRARIRQIIEGLSALK